MQTAKRLIDHFSPEHYELSLDIRRVERTFTGTVAVDGVMQRDGSIWLHSKDLVIDSCVVDGNPVEFIHGDNDELELKVNADSGTRLMVELGFNGRITNQMHGMYPCFYEHDGTKKELIATQFESHHAREVFPCIDEPSAKATFDVTLGTETGITVLGNMPVVRQEESDDRLATTFGRSPKMSSYLLAWVCGELHKKTATTKSGAEVNIWATPAQKPEGLDFALDIATRTIDFFDEYFGVPYPLPKCDHVALPDFSSGAMENWGLITYREVALLAEPGAVSVSSKHRIAAVIAHELSHQWFGNLVTMKWWNNLWLNESFANLMEYIAIDNLEPSWNVWFEFASYETVMSLRRDATDGVQAVQVDVDHPDEISTLFDPAIVYAKGSRLLRMLERHIGAEAFRDGLRIYFKRHAYGNTAETDLWEALTEASGEDIGLLMTPWISQPGYPVLSVTTDGISQQQFFIGEHEPSDRLWPIPLGSDQSDIPRLFDSDSSTVNVRSNTRFNIDDSAHFITRYPDDMLETQLRAVASNGLEPVGRLQLLHEQTLLARGQYVTSASLIPVIQAYRHESVESVWDIMSVAIGELKKFVEDDESSEAALRSMVGKLATAQFDVLGWQAKSGEPETDTKLRATIVGLMAYSHDASVIAHAKELARGDIEAIDPELRALVLGTAVRHTDDGTLFDSLLAKHASTQSAELQEDIVSGLTSTRSEAQIEKLLNLIKQPSAVRSQDVARWFVYLIRNRFARERTWKWLKENWDWIEATFGGDKSYDSYPRYAASGLVTKKQLDEYVTFFTPLREQRALTRVIDMGINEIRARVALIESDRDEVREALLDQ